MTPEYITSLEQSQEELIDLLYAALPYVEEGEEFNHPNKRTVSQRIRAAIERAREVMA